MNETNGYPLIPDHFGERAWAKRWHPDQTSPPNPDLEVTGRQPTGQLWIGGRLHDVWPTKPHPFGYGLRTED